MAGFRSQWIIPLPCACIRPTAISRNIASAWSIASGLPLSRRSKRAPLHVIHHVVGRGRVPPDGEELDDVAVGEQMAELFHLAGKQRPVEPAAAVEELDHHPATAVAVDSAPGLAEGPLAQERLLLVPGDVEWRLEPRHAQLAGEPELGRPHHQGRVTDVRHARHPDRWRRGPGSMASRGPAVFGQPHPRSSHHRRLSSRPSARRGQDRPSSPRKNKLES